VREIQQTLGIKWGLAAGFSLGGFLLGGFMAKLLWPTQVEVVRRVEIPVERFIDRRVEVPVDRIVEKRVEVPVVKFIDRPVEVIKYLVPAGPSDVELEDWGRLRRKMTKSSVRALLGDPAMVTGVPQETWSYAFGGSVVFSDEGKLLSWKVPSPGAR
jgi:hypothetical protein